MNGVTQDLQSSLMTMAVTGREGVSPAWAFNCFISCSVSPFEEISDSQPEPACRLWRRPGNNSIIYFRRYVPCTELQMSQLTTCIGSLLQDTLQGWAQVTRLSSFSTRQMSHQPQFLGLHVSPHHAIEHMGTTALPRHMFCPSWKHPLHQLLQLHADSFLCYPSCGYKHSWSYCFLI